MRFTLALALTVLLQSCGEPASSDPPEIPVDTLEPAQPDTLVRYDSLDMREALDARKSSGDTLPVSAEVLAGCLPGDMPGYKLDVDEAQTFEVPTHAYSEATRVFYDEEGKYCEFTLSDYASDPGMMEVLLHRWQGIKDQGTTRALMGADLPEGGASFGWEEQEGRRAVARRILVLDWRYVLKLEATGPKALDKLRVMYPAFRYETLRDPG